MDSQSISQEIVFATTSMECGSSRELEGDVGGGGVSHHVLQFLNVLGLVVMNNVFVRVTRMSEKTSFWGSAF